MQQAAKRDNDGIMMMLEFEVHPVQSACRRCSDADAHKPAGERILDLQLPVRKRKRGSSHSEQG